MGRVRGARRRQGDDATWPATGSAWAGTRLLDILPGPRRRARRRPAVRRDVERHVRRFPDADLVVACDGAGSRIRERHAEHFGAERSTSAATSTSGSARRRSSTRFTFGFEQTAAGWIWFHAYPFTDETSTFIVECTPETWPGLGFDRAERAAGQLRRLARRSSPAHLDGEPLIDQRAELGGTGWLNFRRVTNRRWDHGHVVLMGDAAHTTHFAIGSGTKLAMQDAMALAGTLATGREGDDLAVALERYEHRRKTALAPLQQAAKASSEWFERMADYARSADQAVLLRAVEPAWRVPDLAALRFTYHHATFGTAGAVALGTQCTQVEPQPAAIRGIGRPRVVSAEQVV